MRAIAASAWCSRTRACFRTCRARQPGVRRAAPAANGASGRCSFDDVVQLLGLGDADSRAAHTNCPAARSNAWRSAARCWRSRGCCCSTSRWPRSISRAARKCCLISRSCAMRFAIPIVYVSHQFDEVLRLATRVVLLDAGRVVADGDIATVSRALARCAPSSGPMRWVRWCRGSSNRIDDARPRHRARRRCELSRRAEARQRRSANPDPGVGARRHRRHRRAPLGSRCATWCRRASSRSRPTSGARCSSSSTSGARRRCWRASRRARRRNWR